MQMDEPIAKLIAFSDGGPVKPVSVTRWLFLTVISPASLRRERWKKRCSPLFEFSWETRKPGESDSIHLPSRQADSSRGGGNLALCVSSEL